MEFCAYVSILVSIDRLVLFIIELERERERKRGIEKDWKNRIRFSSCLLAFVSSWAMVAYDDDYDDDKLRDMRTLASCNNSHLIKIKTTYNKFSRINKQHNVRWSPSI